MKRDGGYLVPTVERRAVQRLDVSQHMLERQAVCRDVAAGQASFQVCTACHGADARGNPDMHAPPLLVQSDWYLVTQLRKFKAGWRGTHPQDIWGMTMRPNAMMLDDAGMTNVVAYIQTLRP